MADEGAPGRQPGDGADPAGREGDAEGAGQHVLGLVGLVDDDHVVLGQHEPAGRHVGAEQVEVDDDHVGLPGPLVGGLGEAAPAARAGLGAGALLGADAHRRPRLRPGLEVELGPVAGLALVRPGQQLGDLGADAPGVRAGQGRRVGLPRRLDRRLPAQVVAPALEHGPGQARAAGRRRRWWAGPCRPAGPAAPWWRWRSPPAAARRRAAPRPGTPTSCRCPCRPGRPAAAPRRTASATASAMATWPGRASPPPSSVAASLCERRLGGVAVDALAPPASAARAAAGPEDRITRTLQAPRTGCTWPRIRGKCSQMGFTSGPARRRRRRRGRCRPRCSGPPAGPGPGGRRSCAG